DAIDRFTAAQAPYDEARARLGLARALGGLGRADAAAREATAATQTLRSLGAARDLADAERALAAPRGPGRGPDAELSARELEVLRLVAEGCSDAEIAERLVLSPHTVHRHVANVRVKLRQPSRAAAVAHAAREGLL
ncbi:MAG TPA: helix-turn-helix transcriptional regulator, partial [Capillimicrobium sp.]